MALSRQTSPDSESASSESEGDPMFSFEDKVEPGTNPWLNLDHNYDENLKWFERSNTLDRFALPFSYLDNQQHPFFNTLCIYSSVKWLPKGMFSDYYYRTTQRTLDAWTKENPNIEQKWDLYNRDIGFYERWNEYKDVLYIDIIWKKSWFSNFGIKVKNKVYFWMAQYDLQYERQARIHGRMIVDKLNLCYCAWRKTMEAKPDFVPGSRIPIITFTGFKNHNKHDEWKNTSKYLEWTYLSCVDTGYSLSKIKKKKSNQSNEILQLGSVIDGQTKMRKSIRWQRNVKS